MRQADSEGYVEFESIMDFERLKALTQDANFVQECLEGCSFPSGSGSDEEGEDRITRLNVFAIVS